jgi:hypothetical protein
VSRVDRILESLDTGLQSSNEVQYYGDTYDYCWRCLKVETVGGSACDKCVAWMSCETDEDPVETALADIADFLSPQVSLYTTLAPDRTGRLSERDPSEQEITGLSDLISSGPLDYGSFRSNRSYWQNYVEQEYDALRTELLRAMYVDLFPITPPDLT